MAQLFRIKCPSCNEVQDIPANGPCKKCNTNIVLPEDGVIAFVFQKTFIKTRAIAVHDVLDTILFFLRDL